MVYLIDFVLPANYFSNNLRSLSADMAVLRELMKIKLPDLSDHLEKLQKQATINENASSNSYEPPLTNVFTMQWFLTLFSTCLPEQLVLRVWDCILLEGSEVLLRVALAIWAAIGMYVYWLFNVSSLPNASILTFSGFLRAAMVALSNRTI